jgi:hypothetical protein
LILIPIVSINKGYIERSRSFVIELHTLISLGTNYSFLSGHSILITADSTSTVVLFKGNIPISIYFLIRFHYSHIRSRVKAICHPTYCV